MSNEKFLEVMQHEGPVTIVTINAHPASVVNTWMSYVKLDLDSDVLYIPAAGMHSIEQDFQTDATVILTVGTKEVLGTQGPGAGFHIYDQGSFIELGQIFDEVKEKFPWIQKILQIKVDKIEQKI